MRGTITVPIEEFENLLLASFILTALEWGGVDNWQWYGESEQDYIDTFITDNPDIISHFREEGESDEEVKENITMNLIAEYAVHKRLEDEEYA